jgi:AcrR family transcriptional regulator
MMSQRRNAVVPDDAVLDAAFELLKAVGVRRMKMADIARQAGISRATLYRRYDNVTQVVAALMTREWAAVADQARTAPGRTARDRLVNTTVEIARAIRCHPLLRKIIDLDPEFLLPYLLKRRGTSTSRQLDLIETGVMAGIEDGSVRDGDARRRATAVLLTAWSFVLTGPVLTEDLDALDTELRDILDRYLRP